jgi:hypothetical protein
VRINTWEEKPYKTKRDKKVKKTATQEVKHVKDKRDLVEQSNVKCCYAFFKMQVQIERSDSEPYQYPLSGR